MTRNNTIWLALLFVKLQLLVNNSNFCSNFKFESNIVYYWTLSFIISMKTETKSNVDKDDRPNIGHCDIIL